jgi:hypothetical protein
MPFTTRCYSERVCVFVCVCVSVTIRMGMISIGTQFLTLHLEYALYNNALLQLIPLTGLLVTAL